MAEKDTDTAIRKVADEINKKRRMELIQIYSSTDIFNELRRLKQLGVFDKGNKSKSMRKVASYPVEVDEFFTKIYGPEYYKEPDFFTKYHPEWLTVDPQKL